MDNGNFFDAYEYDDKTTRQEENVPQMDEEIVEQASEPMEEGAVNFVLYQPNPQEEVEETVEQENEEENAGTEEPKMEETLKEEPKPSYNYNYANSTVVLKQKKKSKKKWLLCICLAIVFGIVANVSFRVSDMVMDKLWGEEDASKKTVTTTTTNINKDGTGLTDVAEVASNVMPSVVSITNLSVQEVQNFFFGGTTIQESESSGSGIIVGQNESELLIVSNNHVVEGSSSLTVTFMDESNVEAFIKGTDANLDLAIIAVPLDKISDETLDVIKIATLGDSDALAVGEPAIAIGNALGYGQSVTSGIISALDRQIDGFDASLIQTDAAINPGNSGGALLNSNGEVIGINTVKVSADAVEGMGYAIPISDVNDIINELMNRETRTKVDESERGAIGISGVDVDETNSQLYNMPKGVYVSEIIKGGAADKAGLPIRCIITEIEGTAISSMSQLQEQLEYYKAGEKVELTVMILNGNDEYVEKTYEVTLSERSILND